MKPLLFAFVLTLAFPQNEQLPTVNHDKRDYQPPTETFDLVTRICPQGYEGHFVDPKIGISDSDASIERGGMQFGESRSEYAICLRKDFMDKVRSKPDLLVIRTVPRPL